MKTLTLDLQKRILIVSGFQSNNIYEQRQEILNNPEHSDLLKSKKYKFICLGSELTEEIAKGLVNTNDVSDAEDYRYQITYFDYKDDENSLTSALNSFISAIEAKGFTWENPLGDEPKDIPDLGEFTVMMRKRHREWKEAESKTFHPDRVLIFEIV